MACGLWKCQESEPELSDARQVLFGERTRRLPSGRRSAYRGELVELIRRPERASAALPVERTGQVLDFRGLAGQRAPGAFPGGVVDIPAPGD